MTWPIKLYYIYYLPFAHSARGKVGMTGNCLRTRIIENRKSGYDTTNWRILYATYDFHDALRVELDYQIQLGCVETMRSTYVIKKDSDNDRLNYEGKARTVTVTNIRTNSVKQFSTIRECEEYFGYAPHKGYISNKIKRNSIANRGRLKDLKFDIY